MTAPKKAPMGIPPTRQKLAFFSAVGFALLLAAGLPAAAQQAPSMAVLGTSPKPERLEVIADGHPLSVWVKRPAAPRSAILLVHGRTWGALPNFDLRTEGDERSVMNAFVRRGYATYALDQRGHGATPRDSGGWLTPPRAAKDVAIVLDWIAAREAGSGRRPALLGYSRGALTAMLAAQQYPVRLSMLVLYAFTRDLDEQAPAVEPPQAPLRQPTTPVNTVSDFRTPGAVAHAVLDAFVRQALVSDPVRVDWRDEHEFNALDPASVGVPTLLIHGANDPGTSAAKDLKVMSRLGTADRSLVVLPQSDHEAHLEDSHVAWVEAIVAFLDRPRPSPPATR
jgi:alpha-beta hydrolase superfamily lysophospholipase